MGRITLVGDPMGIDAGVESTGWRGLDRVVQALRYIGLSRFIFRIRGCLLIRSRRCRRSFEK